MLSAVSGLVSALFKARDGVATPADARVVRSGLGVGQPLDAGVRAPMETAYGRTSRTYACTPTPEQGRCPTGSGARAFTVGRDITFSPASTSPEA